MVAGSESVSATTHMPASKSISTVTTTTTKRMTFKAMGSHGLRHQQNPAKGLHPIKRDTPMRVRVTNISEQKSFQSPAQAPPEEQQRRSHGPEKKEFHPTEKRHVCKEEKNACHERVLRVCINLSRNNVVHALCALAHEMNQEHNTRDRHPARQHNNNVKKCQFSSGTSGASTPLKT